MISTATIAGLEARGLDYIWGREHTDKRVRQIVLDAAADRATREAIVAALDAQFGRGDKALIGNAGYRHYLRKTTAVKGQPAFEIDPGKLAEAARFDGIFVLRTNAL
jgi:NAD(P)-dependent dehydrogenase (short-subunit alcohol dehydrogenase family)